VEYLLLKIKAVWDSLLNRRAGMNTISKIKIRSAHISKAKYLTELALRSKSIWGYDNT